MSYKLIFFSLVLISFSLFTIENEKYKKHTTPNGEERVYFLRMVNEELKLISKFKNLELYEFPSLKIDNGSEVLTATIVIDEKIWKYTFVNFDKKINVYRQRLGDSKREDIYLKNKDEIFLWLKNLISKKENTCTIL